MLYDALIIGFGPVGATMANLLARYGLRVAVVESEIQIYDKPRAMTLDHEVLRVFQFCGLAERIAQNTTPHRGTHFLGVDGSVIKQFDPIPPPYPLAWPPTSTFVQPELERVLREGLAAHAGVDVFLGHRALAFTQNNSGVELTVEDRAQRTVRVLQGRVLLGCDGANSFVRSTLGIALEDLGFDECWMAVDARIVAPVDIPQRAVHYCWPARPASFIPAPGNLRRWEIKLLPGEDAEVFAQPDNVIRQIARFADPSCLEVWRAAVYRFHALLAQRWRHGRVFLLGDACHQSPPFLGQGMCAGIRDAANLAWKLALVLQDGATESLLDSYERERIPHVRQLVATAKEFGLIIGELDPEAARTRDKNLRSKLARGEVETIRQRFIPNLIGGVIDADNLARGAGALFVQPRVMRRSAPGETLLLDDLLPFRFVVATATAHAQAWLTLESLGLWRRLRGERVVIEPCNRPPDSLPEDGVHFVQETDTLFVDWMAQMGCAAVVVRPDRYVFGVASDAMQLNRLVAAVGSHVFEAVGLS
jgi:3-(3-hydroxy-phenyl)propionate hydroxylase